ncbi:inner centromere protein A isoform X1 [Sander lucioperca]|uniref:inner centromere protein A isoform X1 n=1 Tax=Sander lucioperca TaxID=283035 RepID=UPI00125E6741|nr:inner centromere protein A isoform X1 [Sander lucioperca]XP_031138819.1 inner centromere protein A isoform X1 [Sander lucioperca]XP_035858702.1 inner centromere protein A isoform X1 [Sander lucioperca]
MNSIRSSVQSLMEMFYDKTQEFTSDIDNVHMVWLEEIQQEANRMFSRDFNAEPELMPKTPSQKKSSRRKRVSLAYQEENQARRRFSKGKRSNLRGSSVKSLNFIAEEETIPKASTSEANTTTQPKRTTRKNKQTKSEVAEDVSQSHGSCKTEEVQNKKPELEEVDENYKENNVEDKPDYACSAAKSPPAIPSPEVVVSISSSDRLSCEFAKKLQPSPGRTAAKIAIASAAQSSRRSSVRCSLKLRHSLAGLRHSMTQESVRRASRRSMLKRKGARMGNSTCSSNVDEDSCVDSAEEEDREAVLDAVSADTEDNAAAEELKDTLEIQINQSLRSSVGRITRSVAANSATLAPPSLFTTEQTVSTPNKKTVVGKHQTPQSGRSSRLSTKRKAPDTAEESPTKRHSPPKKSQSAMRPNMRSFLHTVQKNQMLMMAPNSLGRTAVIKSFIKHTTPLKVDPKLSVGIVSKERHKLEALKKKQEQEEERMKKMEEEKKRKQDELKRKRDERLRRVFEAKVKEEQREEEKKKKIEQKMANIDEKNDKRQADEKAKKKGPMKRQEELEQKRKLEEEAKRKKIQQAEEEKRQQELMAKKKAEEEEEQRIRKLAEARRALELKREQERERELERLAAAERERVEKEKALALQRELERAAREKERRELEEKRKVLEEKRRLEQQQRLAAEEKAAKEREAAAKKAATAQPPAGLNVTVDIEHSVMSTPVGKGGGLNVTVDIEQSPQSYSITPTGNKKPFMSKSAEDYGMDQNSDDSTDDESAPRKPIPSWAEGHNLQQIIMKQYFNPPDLDSFFGTIEPPKLENIFYKSKPRYFKRTSSAVWHSPPIGGK